MENPKISIIVPVYNTEKYLERCINSIINQTLENIEIILINDGSTDNSLDICKRYENEDNRIKLFSINNSGAGAARNIGLDYAKGEYIGFVDSDDWVEYYMFETLYNIAIETDVDIVSSNFYRNYTDKQIKNDIKFESGLFNKQDIKNKILPELICSEKLTSDIPSNMWTKIYKKVLIKHNNISFEEKLLGGQDLLFSKECIIHSNFIYFMNERYLYHYRYNINSRTNTYLSNAWNIYKVRNKKYKEINNDFSDFDFSDQIERDLINSALTAINYTTKKDNPDNIFEQYKTIKHICKEVDEYELEKIVDINKLSYLRRLSVILLKNKLVLLLLVMGHLYSVFNN